MLRPPFARTLFSRQAQPAYICLPSVNWLPDLDSHQDKRLNRPPCYFDTIWQRISFEFRVLRDVSEYVHGASPPNSELETRNSKLNLALPAGLPPASFRLED